MSPAVSGVAFIFPGQGSQTIGMGRNWTQESEAAAVFDEADDVLGFPISRLCWEGPEDELRLTANQQPAILTASVAQYRVMERRGLEPALVAGHSLGEYSALVAAGALQFADAVQLVRRRGQLMQEAVPDGAGAMAAVIGLEEDDVRKISSDAAGDQVCTVANLNAPGQTVIAGHREAVERAVLLAQEGGARRALLLPVSAPFHSPLMRPAREGLAPLLAQTPFVDPTVPVVSNVDARPVLTGEAARDALARQVDSPVRWVESILWMVEHGGVELFVEVGPGRVLSGLVKRIVPGRRPRSFGGPEELADGLFGE